MVIATQETPATYITITEAAARFGISRDLIHRWQQRGEFKDEDLQLVPGRGPTGQEYRINPCAIEAAMARPRHAGGRPTKSV